MLRIKTSQVRTVVIIKTKFLVVDIFGFNFVNIFDLIFAQIGVALNINSLGC